MQGSSPNTPPRFAYEVAPALTQLANSSSLNFVNGITAARPRIITSNVTARAVNRTGLL